MSRINSDGALEFSLDELLTCKEQVTVGGKYYVFNHISAGLTALSFDEVVIDAVTDDVEYPFESDDTAFSYAVRIPEKHFRFMTLEEVKDYWLEHRAEVFDYHVHGQDDNNNGYYKVMITGIRTDECNNSKGPIALSGQWISLDMFVRYTTKEDGTMFVVEEEE